MAHTTDQSDFSSRTIGARLATGFVWPGDAACEAMNVKDPESRMLLRMFINLSIYGTVGVIAVILFA